ncbi:cytochrome-c oxidase, cbb3-type subunit I [Paracrocinitomix mangrovi]|uniref:cytochrome-c oxidase, cbb3-type subunit I n=1 Tax=Paracrocinitomix mangrovi TaxID=2862509 RepID=UPI001C8D5E8E|nr:cytochrome-c oxidase, cbb3-type subunit I [Paracrocinitomix mangrovi]UKN01491.1 cytochrome-c oxidase, cbb3-type subunit I [Paracrocinitomix mangrovi]
MQLEKFSYDNRIVRLFLIATVVWGVIGMLVGLFAALELVWPDLNLFSWLSFGRIRPLHTNAVIFAFVGNGIFAGVYYSLQRLLKTRMFSDMLSKINFWGWQLIILSAVLTLPFGYTTGKEYAELEWPIDIAITLIWVVFGWNMFGTILKRRVKHMYVAIWFYIATFVTVAVLHIVNSFELPVNFLKSYSWYAGVQDALVQWWYGHNAVAFFLTTPYLGLMYYFIPKAANRPVYSYRLSIIHFWALIFIYIWAGPHHLLFSSLPHWAQTLGVVFSVMLIFPSWGGMLNGLLTLRGAWDRVRDDAVLKFMVVAVTCYGMATFEGPILSLKMVNSISHFTDWTVAHVHVGGLGWNGMLTFGMAYFLVPKMWNTKLFSKSLANTHFWLATIGIVLWVIPMYIAGFMQGMMWKEFNLDGTLASSFNETVNALHEFYMVRSLGGALYIVGALIMVYNLVKTAKQGSFVPDESAEAPALVNPKKGHRGEHWHSWIERRPVKFLILSLFAILVGGIVEIIPTMMVSSNVTKIESVQPYTPLELEGRDIYIREGCYNCHSQWVRPFRDEVARYGQYSKGGEFVYDHPFQWGSKRTGPDLHRSGRGNSINNPSAWHYKHLINPRHVNPESVMPAYVWLTDPLDISNTPRKISVMRKLGVPYPEGYEDQAVDDLKVQAEEIYQEIITGDPEITKARPDMEVIALIAYLQRLGSDILKESPAEEETEVNEVIIDTVSSPAPEQLNEVDTTKINE